MADNHTPEGSKEQAIVKKNFIKNKSNPFLSRHRSHTNEDVAPQSDIVQSSHSLTLNDNSIIRAIMAPDASTYFPEEGGSARHSTQHLPDNNNLLRHGFKVGTTLIGGSKTETSWV